MPELVKENNRNISQYPTQDEIDKNFINQKNTITFGDMHGNTINIIWRLINFGIVETEKKNFEDLLLSYNQIERLQARLQPIGDNPKKKPMINFPERITKELQNFNSCLEKIKIKPNNKTSTIRLIGDVFADRGANDFPTLLFLERMRKLEIDSRIEQDKVKFEFLVGNHDSWFLDYLRYLEKSPSTIQNNPFIDKAIKNIERVALHGQQGISLLNLWNFSDKKIASQEEIITLANNNILPSLKLISYDLYTENGKQVIDLFMHAPNSFSRIMLIGQKLGVTLATKDMKNMTAQELGKYIDDINNAFNKWQKTHLINYESYQIENYKDLPNKNKGFSSQKELEDFISNCEDNGRALGLLLSHRGYNGSARGASGFIWDTGKIIEKNDYPGCVSNVFHGHVGETEHLTEKDASEFFLKKHGSFFKNLDANLGKLENTDPGALIFYSSNNQVKTLQQSNEQINQLQNSKQQEQKKNINKFKSKSMTNLPFVITRKALQPLQQNILSKKSQEWHQQKTAKNIQKENKV